MATYFLAIFDLRLPGLQCFEKVTDGRRMTEWEMEQILCSSGQQCLPNNQNNINITTTIHISLILAVHQTIYNRDRNDPNKLTSIWIDNQIKTSDFFSIQFTCGHMQPAQNLYRLNKTISQLYCCELK